MNRIIKFRAKTLDGIWFYWSLLDDIDMGKLAIDVNTVGQSTGLFDKNGKEIFESDILGKEDVYHFIDRKEWEPRAGNWKIIGERIKNFTGEIEERYISGYQLTLVEWMSTSCGFEPFSDSKDNCGHCGGGADSKEFEIIGNIYDNPELLNP